MVAGFVEDGQGFAGRVVGDNAIANEVVSGIYFEIVNLFPGKFFERDNGFKTVDCGDLHTGLELRDFLPGCITKLTL